MSNEEQSNQVVITLTLTADGDVDIAASKGVDLSIIAFIIGLAQHKAHMSYYGMVLGERERKRLEDERSKPKIVIPR